MRRLPDICWDGFPASALRNRVDLSLTSLRIALKAYVATTHAISGRLDLAARPSSAEDQELKDFNLGNRYADECFESVIHLQHFCELFLKAILRADHELLATVGDDSHVELHALLHGREVSNTDRSKLRSIEASLALSRVCALVDHGALDSSFSFVKEYRLFLEQLNGLRNRLWHRGTFTLRYQALDELIAGHGLPFVNRALQSAIFGTRTQSWGYPPLACGIDPIEELIKEVAGPQTGAWPIKKVALLKELGRAAYANPLQPGVAFEREAAEIRSHAENKANAVAEREQSIEKIVECPVCGMSALVIHQSDEGDYDSGEWWRETFLAECEGCTLKLRDTFGNPGDHGFTNFPNYFRRWGGMCA